MAKARDRKVSSLPGTESDTVARFMSVHEVAGYLQINEKKVYALAAEGRIPGTKVTGKWLFPRDLVDQWLTQSSHGGVFTDRLVIAGADDALMTRMSTLLCAELDSHALVAYTATGSQLGLGLLAAGRCDACLIHWGPAAESHLRHPALIQRFPEHSQWVLVRIFNREQGLILNPRLTSGQRPGELAALLSQYPRIVGRKPGSGTWRYFEEALAREQIDVQQLNIIEPVHTGREAVALLRDDHADLAPGSRATASEAGLEFIATGWEALDLVCDRGLYFRTLLQRLLDDLKSDDTFLLAENLGGYDFSDSGRLIWAAQN